MTTGADHFHENRFADVVVMSPTGRLDQDTSNVFQEQILNLISRENAASPRIVLNMGGIEYVSSVGLRALMIVAKQCQGGNGSLALAGLTPEVVEIFDISRFDLIIDVFSDVRGAISSISAQALEVYDEQV